MFSSEEIESLINQVEQKLLLLFKESNSREIFFTFAITSNELLVQTFSEFLIDLDCLSQNVSISRFHDYQKSAKQ